MPEASRSERLTATRQFVIVVRFVIEPNGRVRYGEVIDSHTGRAQRFVGLPGLSAAIGRWMKEVVSEQAFDDAPQSDIDDVERRPDGWS